MDADLTERIRRFMAAHTTLTLATLGSDGRPWAASLFYAEQSDLSLIFVSEPAVLHSRNIAGNPLVSAVIAEDRQAWQEIQGLQLSGSCALLQEHEQEAAWRVYADKFPFVHNNAQLAGQLQAGGFYRIVPDWIRLTDNRRGFGHKEELLLGRSAP